MSQEKVDRYKKEKANRKENVRKEKMRNAMHKDGSDILRMADLRRAGRTRKRTWITPH